MQWVGWFIAILGIWQICAPFIFGYGNIPGAVGNDITVGILVAALGIWAAVALKKKST